MALFVSCSSTHTTDRSISSLERKPSSWSNNESNMEDWGKHGLVLDRENTNENTYDYFCPDTVTVTLVDEGSIVTFGVTPTPSAKLKDFWNRRTLQINKDHLGHVEGTVSRFQGNTPDEGDGYPLNNELTRSVQSKDRSPVPRLRFLRDGVMLKLTKFLFCKFKYIK